MLVFIPDTRFTKYQKKKIPKTNMKKTSKKVMKIKNKKNKPI